jgi:hypothetical protein
MRRVLRWLAAATLAVGAATSTPAAASPRSAAVVEWSKVEVPERADARELARTLRGLLAQAAKKASFGRGKHVTLSARIVELTSEQRGDVLRVSCTLVGRVDGGPRAKSRIAFGGSPAAKQELEKQVLTMVANGVVTRLAQIVRSR